MPGHVNRIFSGQKLTTFAASRCATQRYIKRVLLCLRRTAIEARQERLRGGPRAVECDVGLGYDVGIDSPLARLECPIDSNLAVLVIHAWHDPEDSWRQLRGRCKTAQKCSAAVTCFKNECAVRFIERHPYCHSSFARFLPATAIKKNWTFYVSALICVQLFFLVIRKRLFCSYLLVFLLGWSCIACDSFLSLKVTKKKKMSRRLWQRNKENRNAPQEENLVYENCLDGCRCVFCFSIAQLRLRRLHDLLAVATWSACSYFASQINTMDRQLKRGRWEITRNHQRVLFTGLYLR